MKTTSGNLLFYIKICLIICKFNSLLFEVNSCFVKSGKSQTFGLHDYANNGMAAGQCVTLKSVQIKNSVIGLVQPMAGVH